MSDTPISVDFTLPQLTFLEKLRARVTLIRLGPREAWAKAIYNADAPLAAALRRLNAPAQQDDCYPVFHALGRKDIRILKWALEAGLNPNVLHANNYFDYPLHRAACGGWLAKVNVLLEGGADLERRDGNGYTALACALMGWGENATGDWTLRKATALRLIEAGTDVHGWQRNDRESYLHHTPLDLDVIKALLDKGANPHLLVNPQPSTRFTALDDPVCLLFRGTAVESVEALVRWLRCMRDYGMDETTLSPCGNTFAGVVVQRSDFHLSKEPLGVLQELEKHGYDLLASNPQGDTLLHLWARHQSSLFSIWGDVLLEIPGMLPLAAQRNNDNQTVADVLLSRGEWTTNDPSVMDYVRLLQRAEKRVVLEAHLPSADASLATEARLRL